MLHRSSTVSTNHVHQDRMNQYHAHVTGNTTPAIASTTSYVVTSTHYNSSSIGNSGPGGGSVTVTERYFPEIVDDRASYPNLSPINAIIQDLKRKNVVTAAAASGPAQMSLLDYASDPWGSSEAALGGIMNEQQQQPEQGRATTSTTTIARDISGPSGFSSVRGTTQHGPVSDCPTSTQRQPQPRRPSWDVRYAHQQRRSTFGYSNPQRRPSNPATSSAEDWRQQRQQQQEGGELQHPQQRVYPTSSKVQSIGATSFSLNASTTTPPNSVESSATFITAAAAVPRQMRLNTWLDSPRIERLEAPLHADELLKVTPQLRILSPLSTDMDVAVKAHSPSDNIIATLFSNTANSNNKHDWGSSHFGVPSSLSRFSQNSRRNGSATSSGSGSDSINTASTVSDYKISVQRDRANQQAAAELASLLWICAHEVSLEDYGMVESATFTSVFALVHSQDLDFRMAGVAALDALIDVPSADEERKAIKFANTLSGSLRSAQGDYELLSAVSKALGHMATRTANVDFVESEVTRALEWLRTERSDRRLAAALALKEFAIHAPTAFYSKTSQSTLGQGGSNEFLDYIFRAVRDPQPIVRACAADALSQGLKILLDRQHLSLTGLLCQVHFSVMEGLEQETSNKGWNSVARIEASQHGSLLVVATMIAQTRDFMLPRYDEVCRKVMDFMDHPKSLVRLEVMKLLPRLARRFPKIFARRYLDLSLDFLLASAAAAPPPRVGIDLRPPAYHSLGLLVLAMVDSVTGDVLGGARLPTVKIMDDPARSGEQHIVQLCETGVIFQNLNEIFELVSKGLKYRSTTSSRQSTIMHVSAFHCAVDLVEALGDTARPYIDGLIDDMFGAGLSNDLIQCLHAIAECVPERKSVIEDRLFQAVSMCLAGIPSPRDLCDPLVATQVVSGTWSRRRIEQISDDLDPSNITKRDGRSYLQAENSICDSTIRINISSSPQVVKSLVLSLQTLGTFGDSMGRVSTYGSVVPILPFVENVAAPYLTHPSGEVRRAAALTCCVLLVPPGISPGTKVGSQYADVVENVLELLLRSAVSDPSPVVRLCVVRALDTRYDPFLCQVHHLQSLFLLLQDEILATRAAGVRLLGRLASFNPAPILPFMRKFLLELVVELRCGVDTGRGREEATRLLVVFLRAKSLQRLVHPILPAIVESLPLNGGTPRLVSAALEGLGELAKAAGTSLQPWVKEVVPNILETLQDHSSASKQRTSLRTLAQIAGSTAYVIQPYIDYPRLLSQATDILPGTKRAPWSLRREVFRTLGILGALDPDRYHAVAPTARKGGAVGGAYFVHESSASRDATAFLSHDPPTSSCVRNALTNSKATTLSSSISSHQKYSFNGRVSSSVGFARNVLTFTVAKKESITDAGARCIESDDDIPVHLSMYEQYAMVAQPISSHKAARRMTPTDEEFYPTVTIQALMRIFKDPSLAVHHGMVMQATMFIFKSLGLRCVPFLHQVVPLILATIRICGPASLRESLLKQVATLSGIVGERLRPYLEDVFEIVEQFWSSRHLSTIFSLISQIALGVPDEFRRFVPRLIKLFLTSMDEIQIAEWAPIDRSGIHGRELPETERIRLVIGGIRSLREVLGEYLHVLVPSLLKLSESLVPITSADIGRSVADADLVNICVLTLQTTSSLLEYEGTWHGKKDRAPYWGENIVNAGSLSARVVQPLIRMLRAKCRSNEKVGIAIIDTLCVCARQLGPATWIQLYHDVVRMAIVSWQIQVGDIDPNKNQSSENNNEVVHYDTVIAGIQMSPMRRSYDNPYISEAYRMPQRQDSLLMVGGYEVFLPDTLNNIHHFEYTEGLDVTGTNTYYQSLNQSNKPKINHAQLQRAWDVSQCASRDDWDEWMRRLGIQLLREAPSPSLRASASLAHAYQPLSRELFSAAFVCCWKELSQPYRINLVHALEAAFVADISPEILQALLNLAEFMEHDPAGGLPIDISILADLALKCRAYAKALHYKEREHNIGGSNSCVEALISINRKLDLQEAALGVLKSATMRLEEQRMNDDISLGPYNSNGSQRQQSPREIFYSVSWSTETRNYDNLETLDLAENKERWLAKLGSWTDALEAYEDRLARNPQDFDATLGCMRCLSSSGEWRRVLELAEDNWPSLSAGISVGHEVVDPSTISHCTPFVGSRDQKKALRMCAQAAWRLGRWDDLEKYSSELLHGSQVSFSGTAMVARDGSIPKVDFESAFYSAVLHVHRMEWHMASEAIDAARKAMDGRFTALMAESYNRAYPSMVTAQTLAEMEEIVEYQKIERESENGAHLHPANRPNSDEARERLLCVWRKRLAGCRVDAEVHSSILAVRSLILGPTDEVDATLSLSELSRQAQRFKLAERVLLDPLEKLGADLNGSIFGHGLRETLGLRIELDEVLKHTPLSRIIDELVTSDGLTYLAKYGQVHHQWSRQLVQEAGGLEKLIIQHKLYFAFLKHLWLTDRRDEALQRLSRLCDVVDLTSHCESGDNRLRSACWLELGEWKIETSASKSFIPEMVQVEVLCEFKRSTLLDGGYKAWHNWALLNFRIAQQISEAEDLNGVRRRGEPVSTSQRNHVVIAIKSFVNAIGLGTQRWSASVQQDMLNFLTCLFQYGEQTTVSSIINECIESVAIETWLGVLPQLLARIHIKNFSVRSVLHPLLVRLGEKHPQALMYPLSVLLKSPVAERRIAAKSLMNSLRSHSSDLVEEALMVSSELIRVAILWLDTWHEGLEEASRLHSGEGNVSAMLDLLLPLHEKIEKGAETKRESDFISAFGSGLAQAHQHILDYVRLVTEGGDNIPRGPNSFSALDPSGPHIRHNDEAEIVMNRAWNIYYVVFHRINKQLHALKKLELSDCSPALYNARGLELGVPGSYRVDGSYIKIEKFIPNVQVITSKQRPRKITLRGNDGQDYVFLLKGHEDLRQDERVMQLFGLVNALLERDRQTKKHDLRIQRYAVSPLSHNCGLVGWVPHTDTLHALITDYRKSKNIPLNLEHREMLKIAPDYDHLTAMQKVEVFTDALKKTIGKGNDLYEILWLKSTNSEEWLERRTRYTRSLAVMSIVCYILGLGDRHPSNLMLDNLSGRVLHIDFGDCFEVAMNREKFPEKVPFRLTRMLIKAMEVSGIEGSYRSTCERTMTILRENRDSLVAMLEAFLYDPLISWRLEDLSNNLEHLADSSRLHLVNPVLPSEVDTRRDEPTHYVDYGVPIDVAGRSGVLPISEGDEELDDDDEGDEIADGTLQNSLRDHVPSMRTHISREVANSATSARSRQMYSNIQTFAANLHSADERIASITGGDGVNQLAASSSIARSRMSERTMRQRELSSLLGGEEGLAAEEALNEKALKVIRRVQDKLAGTDFEDRAENGEPLDVVDQVQRLIVQATSVENLSQLFIGWCAFW